jgi:hypothetical protein
LDLLASDACDTPCEDSREEGDCAPSCEDCLCCAHSRVVSLLPTLDLAPVVAGSAEFAPLAEPVALAMVAEIMRVPKSAATV